MSHRTLLYRVSLVVSLIAAVMGTTACGDGGRPTGRAADTVVLVTMDAIRADRLTLFGGPVDLPALNRLAARGILLEDMATVVPQSRPAAATILTGELPMEHGVRNDVSDRLHPDVRTLPAIFGQAGYSTAAFVTSEINSWTSGFQHTFELFDGPETFTIGPGVYAPPVLPSEDAIDHFETWMDLPSENGTRFAWIHLAALQDAATDSPRGAARDTYDEALAGLEPSLSRLLGFLEEWSEKNGPVELFLTGTYGVHLEDDEFAVARGSSYWLDRETLQVPAIIARLGRNAETGTRDTGRHWLPDLFATLANLATGAKMPAEHGVDLLDPARDGGADERVRYAWTWAPQDELLWPVLTAVDPGSGWESFDSDTLEQTSGDPGAEDGALALARRHAGSGRAYRLSGDMRQAMRSSGIRLGDGNLRSPLLEGAERSAFLTELLHLRHHFAQERQRRVGRITKRMVEALPDNLATLYNRGAFLLMAGGEEPAESIFDTLLQRYPDSPEVLHWAAHLALAQQDRDKALALLEGALSLGWSDADLLYDLACVYALQGEVGTALDALDHAVDAGYRNWEWIDQDPDLASLRADPGYTELMGAKGR